MKCKPRQHSIFMMLGDCLSLLLNLLLFRVLFESLGPAEFAYWEWLILYLGLCLLVPRNGIDIVAYRSSVRHPSRLGAWTALTLLIRLAFSFVAIALFLIGTNLRQSIPFKVLIPLSATLPISAISPDLGSRVQGRFRKAGLMLALRNLLFLSAILLARQSSPITIGHVSWLLLASEIVVCLLWWHDAARHDCMPSADFNRLVSLSWRPILRHSLEQSLTRYLRVFSWSLDALLIGVVNQDYWIQIAPSRRFLMTAVVPVAGWLGVMGPMMARQRPTEIRKWAGKTLRQVLCVTFLSVVCALVIGHQLYSAMIGNASFQINYMLALNAIRLFPVIGFLVLAAACTARRQDMQSLWFTATHLFALTIGCLLTSMASNSIETSVYLALSEIVAFGLVLIFYWKCSDIRPSVQGSNIIDKVKRVRHIAHDSDLNQPSSPMHLGLGDCSRLKVLKHEP